MPTQIVEKTEIPNRFLCYWLNAQLFPVSNSRLILDFNAVIEAAKPSTPFVIYHFQAKPAFINRFGVYSNGEYYSVEEVIASTPSRTVKVHSTNLIYPPNAIVLHENSVVSVRGDVAIISGYTE